MAQVAILILGSFLLSLLPTTFCATRLLSRCFRRLRSRSFAQGMVEKRGCTVCGGRASSSAAYHEVGADRGPSRGMSYHPFTCHVNVNITTKTKRRFPPFPRLAPHQSIVHGLGWVLRSGADIDIFQRYPTHGQFHTLCAFVMSFVFDTRCHADAHTRSFHPFQGTFSPPPSNVPIKSSVSEHWEMVASGSVAWTASPNKSIASSTPSVCLYFTLSMRPWLRGMGI